MSNGLRKQFSSGCGGMADAQDSKSCGGDLVWVQVPPSAFNCNLKPLETLMFPMVFSLHIYWEYRTRNVPERQFLKSPRADSRRVHSYNVLCHVFKICLKVLR